MNKTNTISIQGGDQSNAGNQKNSAAENAAKRSHPQERFEDLDALRAALREFVDQRALQPFHTPKNLASALSVEASELLEPSSG